MDRIVRALNSVNSPLHWAAFVGLVAVALLLRIVAFQGYSDSDPRVYSMLANELAQGTLHIQDFDGPLLFPIRLGVYAPTAVLIKVFGLSEATLAAFPFLISILGCLFAYALTRWLGTPLAGLIGLGIFAVLPIDVSMASIILPDAMAAFWANVAVVLAYLAATRSKLRQSALLGVLSGFFFGASWLCRETVAYLIPFVGILVLVLAKQSRLSARITSLAAIGAAALAVLFGEMAFYGTLTGDFLLRLHATEWNYIQSEVFFFNQSSPYYGWEAGGYGKALLKRLFADGPAAMLFGRSVGFLPGLAVIAAAWAVVFRQRSQAMPAVWLVSLLLMFNFMTSSFAAYKPIPIMDRYLYPLLLPSAVLLGIFLAMLMAGDRDVGMGKERRFWAFLLMAVFCAVCVRDLGPRIIYKNQAIERRLAAELREADVVYTDYRSAANLIFFRTGLFLPSTPTTIPYEKIRQQDLPPGAYVLVNKGKTDFLTKTYHYKNPDFTAEPPSTWEKVWTFRGASLYIVDGK